jgi:P-aminobenzoate N-oxygenase AurF
MTSQALNRLEDTTHRLTALSISAYSNPHVLFDWPACAAPDRLAMSTGLLPMAGHPLFAGMNDEQRWRLALLEAVNFFSLNISGERDLMAGLASRLYGDFPVFVSRYLQHFLHEENAHTVVFARFCMDYGGVIFRAREMRFPQQFLPGEEDFVFFARALIFEEIAHFYNRQLADDGSGSVWVLARDINRYHAEDEVRHIAFGRLLVADMWERFGARWNAEEKRRIGRYLARYTQTVLRSYVNADVYRMLGLPAEVRAEVLASAHWSALAEKSTRGITRWLGTIGAGNE